MKIFFLLLLFIKVTAFDALASVTEIVIGRQYQVESKILGENRAYSVYLPPSYDKTQLARYPVIYLLDGDVSHLKSLAGLVEALSTERLEAQIKEAIIVAVPNSTNAIRERDFTPTNVYWTFNGEVLEEFENIGNAPAYVNFFENELIPKIDNKYRTTPQRVLVGESFGGLFASYVLMMNNKLFTDYLIIDATYLWDNNYLNRQFDTQNFATKELRGNVYFTFANNAKAFGDIGIANYNWGKEFAEKMSSHPSNNLNIKQQYFENETHGTVAALSWYFGLRDLLKNN
jgi:predicted alpha/beta superfamily hydrolase